MKAYRPEALQLRYSVGERTDDSDLKTLSVIMRTDEESKRHLRIGQWIIDATSGHQLYYMENEKLFAMLEEWRNKHEE